MDGWSIEWISENNLFFSKRIEIKKKKKEIRDEKQNGKSVNNLFYNLSRTESEMFFPAFFSCFRLSWLL